MILVHWLDFSWCERQLARDQRRGSEEQDSEKGGGREGEAAVAADGAPPLS